MTLCTMWIGISFALIIDGEVVKLTKVINPVRTRVNDVVGRATTPDLRLNVENIKVET